MFFKSKHSKNTHIVSASEVAQHAFCPEACRLSILNSPISHHAQKRIEYGNHIHAEWALKPSRFSPFIFGVALIFLILAIILILNRGS